MQLSLRFEGNSILGFVEEFLRIPDPSDFRNSNLQKGDEGNTTKKAGTGAEVQPPQSQTIFVDLHAYSLDIYMQGKALIQYAISISPNQRLNLIVFQNKKKQFAAEWEHVRADCYYSALVNLALAYATYPFTNVLTRVTADYFELKHATSAKDLFNSALYSEYHYYGDIRLLEPRNVHATVYPDGRAKKFFLLDVEKDFYCCEQENTIKEWDSGR